MDLGVISNNNLHYLILLQEFTIFLLVAIVLVFIFLLIGALNTLKNLNLNTNFKQKIKLLYQLLIKEPALIFALNAPRDNNGTFYASFEKHKSYQRFSRKNFFRLVGLSILVIIIILILSSNLNHISEAKYFIIEQNIGVPTVK